MAIIVIYLSLSQTETRPSKLETTDPNTLVNENSKGLGIIKKSVPELPKPKQLIKIIEEGDTLSDIFNEKELSQKTMFQILDTDQHILVLDSLQPGNRLKFWLNSEGKLDKLGVFLGLSRQVFFTRTSPTEFTYKEVTVPGTWKERVVSGEINGSFYVSASKKGLNPSEIGEIESLLKGKLSFSRDIRAGDRFYVLYSNQYINHVFSGNRKLLGVKLANRGKAYTAFLADNGSYYDEKGRSLERAFNRYPTQHRFRVSSPFNPKRFHPVTHRWAPHNGVDFATPIGTKVKATGDGIVTIAINHPFAGKYVAIKNSSKYSTRFLHLSKILVRKGQRVTRGQVIAYTGNTGRTTGPHLHYELQINGKPANPLTANIPLDNPIPEAKRKVFLNQVASRLSSMDSSSKPKTVIASNKEEGVSKTLDDKSG